MLLLWCACVITFTQAQDAPRVRTQQGWIVGRKVDGDHWVFHGIPYAGPTSGANRFKPPTAVPKHSGDFHAVDDNVVCAQPTAAGTIRGVEDCLILNIRTKNLDTRKPVLVWLDGENYQTTTNTSYTFKPFMENVVVVTINYRLSIFGFLCLRVPEAPGNAGLKDVIQGLKWIRDNIAGFGGDPNNVMLVGHGSAAAMVDLITLSPLVQNLVHKAVVLSGSALSPWGVSYNPIESAQFIGDKLEYTNKTRSQLVKLLIDTDQNTLKDVLTDSVFYNASLLFAPCIEDVSLNPKGTFLADAPIKILKSGNYLHIPYLAGYSNREGNIRIYQAVNDEWTTKMENNFKDFLPCDLSFYSEENREAISRNIRQQYFGSDEISMKNLDKYLNYHGDVLVLAPVVRGTRERAATSREDVRLFEFAYNGTLNSNWPFTIDSSMINNSGTQVISKYFSDIKYNTDVNATKSIVHLFTAFASSEKSLRSLYKNETWLPINETVFNKLYISAEETLDHSTFYSEKIIKANDYPIFLWETILQYYYKAPEAPMPQAASASPIASDRRSMSFIILIQLLTLLPFFFKNVTLKLYNIQ